MALSFQKTLWKARRDKDTHSCISKSTIERKVLLAKLPGFSQITEGSETNYFPLSLPRFGDCFLSVLKSRCCYVCYWLLCHVLNKSLLSVQTNEFYSRGWVAETFSIDPWLYLHLCPVIQSIVLCTSQVLCNCGGSCLSVLACVCFRG